MNKDLIESIHQNSFIIDSHFDLAPYVEVKRKKGARKVIENEFLSRFKKGGFNLIVSSIFVDDYYLPEMALRKALNQISAIYEDIDESSDKIRLCKSIKDIEECKKDNKMGILLSFEGVEPLYNDISILRIFYELGVRGVGLTWSRRNYAADGCSFHPIKEGKKGGLSNFGIRVIEEAEKLGMFIDVSHINDEGFYDTIKYSNKPIIASHSNSRVISNTMRNLTDDQLIAIASRGGVVGINGCSIIVSNDVGTSNIKKLVDHIEHIKKIIGIEYIGLGFDFCDHLIGISSTVDAMSPFDIIKGHENLHKLTDELLNRGYKDEEIINIYGGNFYRVYRNTIR